MSGIVTPHEAALEGQELIEYQEMKANQAALVRLAKVVASPFCGMTSRPPVYEAGGMVSWASYIPPLKMTRRFSCTEVARESHAWAEWLTEALGIVKWGPKGEPVPVSLAEVAREVLPKPPSRTFIPEVWPTIGMTPEKKRRKK